MSPAILVAALTNAPTLTRTDEAFDHKKETVVRGIEPCPGETELLRF